MRAFILSCGFLGAATLPCPADSVRTADGSVLVGTVVKLADNKLIIETAIAGRLEIDAGQITAIEVDHPIQAQFATGDRLVGTIELQGGQSPVMNTALGRIPIDTDQVTMIWPEGEDSPEVVAVREEAEAQRLAIAPKWTTTLEAGGVMREGNTETLDASGRFESTRKTDTDLLKFFLAAQYSEQNDNRTQNEYRGGMAFERNFTDRWFWYVRNELEFDEFENLDLRATVAAGVGYYWIKKAEHELKTRAGVGYRHESYDNGASMDEVIADLGLDYRRELTDWAQFTHSTTWTPGLEDFDDYRLSLDTALTFSMANTDKWKFKLGMRNEYDNQPQPGIERLDNTYYANLVFEIKRPK